MFQQVSDWKLITANLTGSKALVYRFQCFYDAMIIDYVVIKKL